MVLITLSDPGRFSRFPVVHTPTELPKETQQCWGLKHKAGEDALKLDEITVSDPTADG